MCDNILQIQDLTKSFSGVKALNNVQFNLRRGEVHALMGENGAGKSTLMKILIGLLPADSGSILFDGEDLTNSSVSDTLAKGISMIHQEMLVVPELTVAQNIFLGRESKRGLTGWLNDKALNKQAEQLLRQLKVSIRPDTKIKHLRVAEMQMVEIARAISNNAKVIIMDEPTSALSDHEVATLFSIIRNLKQQGVAIIYISHKMDEIFAIADTITVLRDGNYIDTQPATALDSNALIRMMVGREIEHLFPESTHTIGETVLSVRKLSQPGKFSDINFDVHAGEILGLAGLMGAGRTEIARAIFGLDQVEQGEIQVRGQSVTIQSTRDAIRHGIGYVSEDRKALGFVPGMSVRDNITLSSLSNYTKGWFIQEKNTTATALKMMHDLRIKASGPNQPVKFLSGGNQQKVVIGGVLLSAPDIIILDEPTRGIDIGAKFEIYSLIRQLASTGIAIILISSELPEIVGLCDRVLVLSAGQQTALLSRKEATQETIMRYAVHT